MFEKIIKNVLEKLMVVVFLLVIGMQVATAGERYDKVKIGADFRYRHENIVSQKDQLDGMNIETYDEIRDRQRIRFRLKAEGKVNDNWNLVGRVATGDGGTESTNQTLDDGYANKEFDLDLAYAEGKVFGVEATIVTVRLGKIVNPMFDPGKSQLLWDGDVTPEGIGAIAAYDVAGIEFFANAGGFWLNEVKLSEDMMCYCGQAGVKARVGDIKLTVGGGLNAVTLAYETMGQNINVGEGFLEASTKMFGQPVKIFAHYAQNGGAVGDEILPKGSTATETEKVDPSAMAFGAQFGKTEKTGSYQIKALYKKYGNGFNFIYTDSDFAGGGEMDSSGVVVAAAYAPWEKTTIGATYFINTYEDTNKGDYSPLKYNRLQIDFSLKY